MLLIILFSLITLQSYVAPEPINYLNQLDQKSLSPVHQELKRSVVNDVELDGDSSVVRSKRDLADFLRSFFDTLLAPVRSLVEEFFNGIINFLTPLYVSSEPSNVILAFFVKITNPIVLYVLNIVASVRSYVVGLIGTNTILTSRRKRELFNEVLELSKVYNLR